MYGRLSVSKAECISNIKRNKLTGYLGKVGYTEKKMGNRSPE